MWFSLNAIERLATLQIRAQCTTNKKNHSFSRLKSIPYNAMVLTHKENAYKMQPLQTTRKAMMWILMCPTDESSRPWQKKAYVAYFIYGMCMTMACFWGCLEYFLRYWSTDFEGSVYAVMCFVGGFSMVYFMIAAAVMREKVGYMFKILSEICENRKLNPNERWWHQLMNEIHRWKRGDNRPLGQSK